MQEECILRVDNVVKRFGGLFALRKVSFDVEQGKVVGLIGPNGSGKTTLFNCISGMYAPEEGSIIFQGENIVGLKPHKIARRGIGRTFQIARPFNDMSVMDNVYVGAAFGCTTREESGKMSNVCNDVLRMTNLESKANDLAESLTFGEKRRLEIARALALRPKLLLLDETMAGLTSTEVDHTLQMIKRITGELGLSVMVVEHVMRAIMAISDKVVVLSEGEKIAEGSPKEVAEDPTVLTAYLGDRGE